MDVDGEQMLLQALKKNETKEVERLLKTCARERWPVHILLPFTLRAVLKGRSYNSKNLRYMAECFLTLSRCSSSSTMEQYRAIDLHKRTVLLECSHMVRKHSNEADHYELSDQIMRKFEQITQTHGKCRVYGRQFTLLVTVCQSRRRLLRYKKRPSTVKKQATRLKQKGLEFITQIISRM